MRSGGSDGRRWGVGVCSLLFEWGLVGWRERTEGGGEGEGIY